MYEHYEYQVDPKEPLKPLYQGTYEETVTVGGKQRRYLVYIPKGARHRPQVCSSCQRTERPQTICGTKAGGA